MKQTDRIRRMEACLDMVRRAVDNLSEALDRYQEAQDALKQLDAYYGSEEWRQDLADDEAGRLPRNLKRGVLSEDAAWNTLADARALERRMAEMRGEKM
ncbi:MAG: DUF4298 domain-containing protein [Bacteroidaceae bacterium]|nr:DUF4298 domain-containing protein [Bacteroidaceae bacterium]